VSTHLGRLSGVVGEKRIVSKDTRSALLGAAAGLLEERGIGAVTLRAVGERAGVSRGAPYKHFADKEALLSVLAAGYFGRLGMEMWGAAEEAGGSFSRLRALGEAYVRFALANPHRYRLMFGEKMQTSPHPEVHEAAHALYEGFVGAVADCQEAGELAGGDPMRLAALIYATVHGAVDLALAGGSKGLEDPASQLRLLLYHLGGGAGG
jgi:AcrR family transcriptional regulator